MIIPTLVKVPLIRGDTQAIIAELVHAGGPYTPPFGSIIIFTAKRNPDDGDIEALFQKVGGTNLTIDGSTATIQVYPEDTTFAESDRDGYYADVQVQPPDGSVITVWLGKLLFTADVTRELTTSIPIYTENPPQPGSGITPTPSYTFIQAVPSVLWIVNHNLGTLVATTVFDTSGNEIEAEIANPTLNQTRITFSTPTAGKARCM